MNFTTAKERRSIYRVIERNSIKFWEEVWGNFAPVFESNTPIYGLRVNYRARFVRQTRVMITQVGGLTRSLVADLEKLEIFEYWSLKSRCEYSLYLLFPSRWSNESKKEKILSTTAKRNSIDADSTIHINACFRLKLGISLRFEEFHYSVGPGNSRLIVGIDDREDERDVSNCLMQRRDIRSFPRHVL